MCSNPGESHDMIDEYPVNAYEIYFTHNCCKNSGPKHEYSAVAKGRFRTRNILHYTMNNVSSSFFDINKEIFSAKRGAGY